MSPTLYCGIFSSSSGSSSPQSLCLLPSVPALELENGLTPGTMICVLCLLACILESLGFPQLQQSCFFIFPDLRKKSSELKS